MPHIIGEYRVKGKNMTKYCNIRMDGPVYDRMQVLADAENTYVSVIVRRACAEYLEAHDG
jgi:predicted transcriptional regulator